jgi:NADH-quinone oxidoreductase subunit G
MRVLPRENEEVNECWISDKDRFSYEALNSGDRLQADDSVDGALREVEWNVALDYVCHALKDVASRTAASNRSAGCTAFNAGRTVPAAETDPWIWVRERIDFRPRRRDFSADGKLPGSRGSASSLSEIKELDAALVVGSFLRKDHPLFAQRLRQLAKKGGQGQSAFCHYR